MVTQPEQERLELLQGTLDLLILQTLIFGKHGQGIARLIQEASEDDFSSSMEHSIRHYNAWKPEGGSAQSGGLP